MYPKLFTQGETGIFVLAAIVFTSIIWWISAPVIEITQPKLNNYGLPNKNTTYKKLQTSPGSTEFPR